MQEFSDLCAVVVKVLQAQIDAQARQPLPDEHAEVNPSAIGCSISPVSMTEAATRPLSKPDAPAVAASSPAHSPSKPARQ